MTIYNREMTILSIKEKNNPTDNREVTVLLSLVREQFYSEHSSHHREAVTLSVKERSDFCRQKKGDHSIHSIDHCTVGQRQTTVPSTREK